MSYSVSTSSQTGGHRSSDRPGTRSTTAGRCRQRYPSRASSNMASRTSTASLLPALKDPTKRVSRPDRLSLYLERVSSEAKTNSTIDPQITEICDTAKEVIQNVLRELFTTDIRFIRTFDLSLTKLEKDPGSFIERSGDKTFDCRLFVRNYERPNVCQVSRFLILQKGNRKYFV